MSTAISFSHFLVSFNRIIAFYTAIALECMIEFLETQIYDNADVRSQRQQSEESSTANSPENNNIEVQDTGSANKSDNLSPLEVLKIHVSMSTCSSSP